ncbi:unnamed protein product [Arabidopsis thaliana]|uniref:Uncharacterized protein n=1 Tax=Arabidopsis thaliana TaxID=3702 RepID=A0A654EAA5_ARATH|nr:unnamed protein product [Arabidopsis thaliana]VYS46283.1 unnamed protein product [Arabidopsis thaliana]
MYCLQVAAYHLFFAIFQNISPDNRVGEPRTASFMRFSDTQQAQGDFNLTFSGVFLESVIKDVAEIVF